MELKISSLINDANLKAYYRFNSGALTVDSSTNGVTLTNNNTVGEATGKFGIGADGGSSNTNKSLSTSDTLGIDGGSITISCWIKLNTEIASSLWFFVFQGNNTSKVSYQMRYEYNGGTRRMLFNRGRLSISDDAVIQNIALGTSNWHHLVLTYDGTNVRGYIDGSLVGTTASSGNGSGTQVVGTYVLGPDFYPSAIIDDLAIFNRALNSSEISNLYTEGSGFFNFF